MASATEATVEECEYCTGSSLKISGLCVLHYVAREHTIDEFEKALEEVQGLEERREQHRASREQFIQRAREAFPDRYVSVYMTPIRGLTDNFQGQNIYWASNPQRRNPKVYHSDKLCPYFPEGALKAYPATYVKSKRTGPRPCPYCVHPSSTEAEA